MIMSLIAQYLIPAMFGILALNGALMAWWYYNYKKVKARYEGEKFEALKKQMNDSIDLDVAISEHNKQSSVAIDTVKNADYSDGVNLK